MSAVAVLLVTTLLWTAGAASQSANPGLTDGTAPPSSTWPEDVLLVAGPPLFSYQGQLLNASGAPITNPSVAMTFRLFTTATGGTACWSESRTVDVRNGVFSVLLGQITAINSACLAGDAYTELVVGGETLTPRERLTSVAHAVQASYLPDGAVAQGSLGVVGNLSSLGSISAQNPNNVAAAVNLSWLDNVARIRIGGDGVGNSNGLDIQGPGNRSLLRIYDDGSVTTLSHLTVRGNIYSSDVLRGANVLGAGNQQIHMPGGDDMYFNWHSGRSVHFGGGNQLADVSITPTGMDLHGNSITNCGALVEANLQTREEIEAGRIDRFELGDLLCWSAKDEQLDLCSTANDSLIMAVGDSEGRPIVLGAELVKVLGPVQAGDYLVASDVPGYAMATRTPSFGIVIAQALESFDGDQGLIKAMIRKM